MNIKLDRCLRKKGLFPCPECDKEHRFNEFLKKARKIHGDKYDYSKVNYINNITKVCIICPKHGEVWQTPSDHLINQGCSKCGFESTSNKLASNTKEFIEKSRKIHGDKYNYSKVEYINSRKKVELICPYHGSFWQPPTTHLSGSGCPDCGIKNYTNTTEDFIRKSKEIHGDKYDYSRVKYINNKTKVEIICPTHGSFFQTASQHLLDHGCPRCNISSSKAEGKFEELLILEGINHILHYKEATILSNNKHLDFYFPDIKLGLEIHGSQHFEIVEHYGGKKGFKRRRKNDTAKLQECKDAGIRLLYYSEPSVRYDEFLGEPVYHDFNELIKIINDEITKNRGQGAGS